MQNIKNKHLITSRPKLFCFITIAGMVSLVLLMGASIAVGAANISLQTVIEAIFSFNFSNTDHQIIYEIRIPRTLVGALIGIGFAVSGSIMQGMTRNPMASPGIMGINAGASFAISLAFAFLPGLPYRYLIFLSFGGAIMAALTTYTVGSSAKGGLTPVRLALAGTAVSSLLSSLASGISIYFETSQDVAFWFAGGVAASKWMHVYGLLPWIIGGLLGSIALSPSITVLSLGEETAIGLGQNIKFTKAMGTILSISLAGACVSAAGPVGFVGLIIPHITRFLVGSDYRYIIPCSAVLGSLFMVLSDILARMINPPYETPIGVITALVGVPFFLYLARTERSGL